MQGDIKMSSRTRNFFLNFIALTVTALVMRGVGVIFNVYVSNKAGAEAMGLYSLLGGIYMFAVTVGCANINLGTTRVISDAMGTNNYSLAKKTAKKALKCALISSTLATIILFFAAEFIGEKILYDMRIVRPLRILAVSLVPVALCSCLSGYFTAVRRVKAISAIQICVQLSKIIITSLLLSVFIDKGAEYACIALVLGAVLSEFLSLLCIYFLYRSDSTKNLGKPSPSYPSDKSITKNILSITVPVTFSACIRSGLTTVQHILIPKGIKASGKSWSAALASYGILHSMVMPVILFPSAFITSFSGLLIPEVTECRVQNDNERLSRLSYRIITLSLFFSIGVSGIMIFYSYGLGTSIYNSDQAAYYIRLMAPLIPVMYIDSALDAVLKGMGHEIYSMNVNIADALTACILAFVLIPRMGIMGYVISIYSTEILNTSLSLFKMISVTKMKFKLAHQIVMPIICIVGATNISHFLLRPTNISSTSLNVTVHILLSVLLYVGLLCATQTVGKDEKEVIHFALKK
ncbi:MAG: hypothetical protein E7667_00835 [Ruminococcaceae bacterium]|nr:hypothetical protein [Oscillospiraceae bacterium]